MTMSGGPRRRARRGLTVAVGAAAVVMIAAAVVATGIFRPAAGDSSVTGDPPRSTGLTSASTSAATASDLGSIAPTSGYVLKVVDGDTLHVRIDGTDEKVRIIGINAPETDECWGGESTEAAARLLDGATVTLVADPTQADRDRYGRLLRYVMLPDGTDVGLRMISDGDADEYTYDNAYANQQAYRAAYAAAAAGGLGLWSVATCGGNPAPSGTLTTSSPSTPLPSTPSPSTAPTAAKAGPNGCDIKGNISANGKIYHLPGTRDYDRTSIDEAKGERWFCSIAEAQAAGWRAPGT